MLGPVVILAVLFAVVLLIGYVWKHKSGTVARSVGAAGAKYNHLYGQGAPPEIPRPAAPFTATRDEPVD